MINGLLLGGAIGAMLVACVAFRVATGNVAEREGKRAARIGWSFMAISIGLSSTALFFSH